MTNPEFLRNQEIPDKLLKAYEQIKLDLFKNFYLFIWSFIDEEPFFEV